MQWCMYSFYVLWVTVICCGSKFDSNQKQRVYMNGNAMIGNNNTNRLETEGKWSANNGANARTDGKLRWDSIVCVYATRLKHHLYNLHPHAAAIFVNRISN